MLVAASAIQGMGTGVAGVMARTMPRDLYAGTALRYANSLLNMGILVSPLLAPVIGGALAMVFGWRACYAFLLALCACVAFAMFRWLPETRPVQTEKRRMLASFRQLLGDSTFSCYLVMLIGALAGIAVFEASCGVLMGGVLGLSGLTVSILFILPIPAAFFGARYAGRDGKTFHTLMWHSVISCLLAGAMMWIGLVRRDEHLDADRAGRAVLLRRRHAVPAGHHRGDGAVPLRPARRARWWAACRTWDRVSRRLSAMLPQTGQFSLGLLMFAMALLILLCWWRCPTGCNIRGIPHNPLPEPAQALVLQDD